jgi:hypothetical protein
LRGAAALARDPAAVIFHDFRDMKKCEIFETPSAPLEVHDNGAWCPREPSRMRLAAIAPG